MNKHQTLKSGFERDAEFLGFLFFKSIYLLIWPLNILMCQNVKRTIALQVRKKQLNALSHIPHAKTQNILFVKPVRDRLNN
ncbi:MAG: hypothetical protein JGK17_21085 [Microcoleus sp. PH2017_10_PVI_O_A]|uniref:hypothetical protein n=1 Tax=unclassified Microcoleus TaxID=2642155 RepID=UPI001D78EEF9|nr:MULTISPECIES: hypothetical protein [unclassified Microcoleus]MCC3408033.1 hypothetical protein [Microcoleus sp. PH2017_10_PVI_O_A]MCC3462153.1 hypothetical protein [Microcoleus sp. PH2017_11_PCY_U_A]MCC3480586.1 hypothetical protein [Microcoleus sp. PH2017_12_PCY_D_A]MCC3561876.1 hypothetical protein [Microcoleus sp. PH2017_27_LUM_O_A]